MKNVFFSLMLAACVCAIAASLFPAAACAAPFYRQSLDGTHPAEIVRPDATSPDSAAAAAAQLDAIVNRGILIDTVTSEVIRAFVTPEETDWIRAQGWEIREIPDRARQMFETLTKEGEAAGDALLAYHTYDDLTSTLTALAAAHPNIARLISAGKSIQGRDLWFMKISDNVDVEEDEPEFQYISSMHGNEPVGMECLLDLIQRLLDGYGTDARLTSLVNETEIWIMPLMNPDGYVLARRGNANNIDLNRNFPDPVTSTNNTVTGRQTETQVIMNFMFAHHPVLAANFHTGALVANYPWDHKDAQTVDNAEYVAMCLEYSNTHPRMHLSTEFTNGIVLGAQWYIVHGGMQDWAYIWQGCMEITVELSDTSWPAASEINNYISENRESLLLYMEWVHRGVRGIVTNRATGQPMNATVRVVGRESFATYTDPDVGDYHRILLPGTYSLKFEAQGFDPIIVQNVVVTSGAATRLDVGFGEPPLPGDAWILY